MVDLKEWAMNYFRFRSQYFKYKIVENKGFFELDYGDRKEKVICVEDISEIRPDKGYFVIRNSNANIDFLDKNWDKFLIPNLKIIFVNNDDTKWIVHPSVHDKVCDRGNIRVSLLSLAGYGEE